MLTRPRAARTPRTLGGWASRNRTLAWLIALVMCLPLATATAGGPDPLLERTSTDKSFAAGSYIIDMSAGVTAGVQTEAAGLQPYGLIYKLVVDAKVPVYWIIKDGKTDQVQTAPGMTNPDLTATVVGFKPTVTTNPVSKAYYSSAFVIPDEFMDDLTLSGLTSGLTVRVDKATEPFTAPVFDKINYWPKATLNNTNSTIAAGYYNNAGIPAASTSYNLMDPQALDGCADLFVMPHADPKWATHSNLLAWNRDYQGYIFAGCHAVPILENVTQNDVAGGALVMNFLSTNGLLIGGTQNGPVWWYGANLAPGITTSTPGTTTADRSDPIMQFIGGTGRAHLNGAEADYEPRAGSVWRDSVRLITWDPDYIPYTGFSSISAAALYGRAFDDPNRGLVMYEAGHDLSDGTPDDTAAQRAFFNFVLLSGIENAPNVELTMPTAKEVKSGETINLSTNLSGGSPNYTYKWTSTCGGTFSNPSGTSGPGTVTTTFTAPTVDAEIGCQLRAEISDTCNRKVFDAGFVIIQPLADVAITKTASPAVAPAGTDITYTLTATNNGPSTATGVVVKDVLPAGVTYVSASDNPTVSADSKTLTWNLGSLAKDATKTLTVTVRAGTTAGTVTNTATISTTSVDLVTTNNTASANTQIVNSSLAVTKVANPTLIDRDGGQVTFTFEVRNTGQNPLHDVQISDNPVCTMSPRSGDTGNDGVLPAPVGGTDVEVWTYTCSTTVNAGTDVDANTPGVQDKVTVTALDNGNYQISGTATATVTLAAPAIAVDKKLFPVEQRPAPGQPAIFKIVVTNTGNVPLTNVSLADTWDLPANQTNWQCTTDDVPDLAVGEDYTLVCAAPMPATPTWGTLASDNFDTPATPHATDSYKNGNGWPTGSVWDEEGTNTDDNATAGNIQIVNATLPATNGTTSNVLRIVSKQQGISRAISPLYVEGKLTFSYYRSAKFNEFKDQIHVQSCTTAGVCTTLPSPAASTITGDGTKNADSAWSSMTLDLPLNTAKVRFYTPSDLTNDLEYFYIDNVVIESKDYINTVTASGTDQFNDTVTATDSSERITPGTSSLAITKTANPPTGGAFPLQNNNSFTYTVTVQNTGSVWQTGVVVTDELPDGLVPTSGQPVTASKTLYTVRASDNFGTTTPVSYSTGTGWGSNTWTETTEPTSDPAKDNIQVVTTAENLANSLFFTTGPESISRTVDLSGATAGAVRFDCKRQSANSEDDNLFLKVVWGATPTNTSTVVSVLQTSDLCSTTEFKSTGYFSLPTNALVNSAKITLEVTGDRDFWVDNLEIITTTGTQTSVPAGTPPTLSTDGGYTLAPNETITFTVPVTVSHGSDNGTSFVNYATADSNQSDPVTAAVTTPYVAPNTLRIVRIEKQALNCDSNAATCPLTGAEFTLYTSDPLAPNPVAGVPLTNVPAGSATFTTAKLRVERDYWIVETKAPDDFQLLAQPIKFRFTETQLELDPATASGLVTTSALITPAAPATPYFTLTVTNLPAAADLPKAGGEGSLPFLALGLLLVAGATTYYRMTSRPPIAPRRAM